MRDSVTSRVRYLERLCTDWVENDRGERLTCPRLDDGQIVEIDATDAEICKGGAEQPR